MNVTSGGVWRFDMHSSDGTNYPNLITYQEVTRPERLVDIHGDDQDGDLKPFHVTVTLDDLDGKTKLTMRMRFGSVEESNRMRDLGAIEGNNQTLDRLAGVLATS